MKKREYLAVIRPDVYLEKPAELEDHFLHFAVATAVARMAVATAVAQMAVAIVVAHNLARMAAAIVVGLVVEVQLLEPALHRLGRIWWLGSRD